MYYSKTQNSRSNEDQCLQKSENRMKKAIGVDSFLPRKDIQAMVGVNEPRES